MVVELDRDPTLYPDGNIVEVRHEHIYGFKAHDTYSALSQWHQNPSHPALDGFTIRRTGDTPTKVRLILHLQQYPEQFRVLPELGEILVNVFPSRLSMSSRLREYPWYQRRE